MISLNHILIIVVFYYKSKEISGLYFRRIDLIITLCTVQLLLNLGGLDLESS